jgi:hypothetical protein
MSSLSSAIKARSLIPAHSFLLVFIPILAVFNILQFNIKWAGYGAISVPTGQQTGTERAKGKAMCG